MTTKQVLIRGRSPEEYDLFMTHEQAIAGLFSLLEQGRVDEAADVYMRCQEDLGYALMSEGQAAPDRFKMVANLLYKARDYEKAAQCCEQLEEADKAAVLYERAGNVTLAAQMYARAGDNARAAAMFDKSGDAASAAQLYAEAGEVLRAADCYARCGRPLKAGKLYQEAGRGERALEVIRQIDPESGDAPEAALLAADVLAAAGRPEMAVAALNEIMRGRAPSQHDAGVWERRAQLRLQLGDTDGAAEDVQTVLSVSPDRASALELKQRVEQAPKGPAPVDLTETVNSPSAGGVVRMMEGFEVLGRLPMFAELSLADLKSLYHLCEVRRVPANERLLTEGQATDALWVVLEGEVQVSAGDKELARLGPGAHVGEMGLIDHAPASAHVTAMSPVSALRLERGGFTQALATNDRLALSVYGVWLRDLSLRLRQTSQRVA
jgi:tetratricopeptide (TPR) repeat protein